MSLKLHRARFNNALEYTSLYGAPLCSVFWKKPRVRDLFRVTLDDSRVTCQHCLRVMAKRVADALELAQALEDEKVSNRLEEWQYR